MIRSPRPLSAIACLLSLAAVHCSEGAPPASGAGPSSASAKAPMASSAAAAAASASAAPAAPPGPAGTKIGMLGDSAVISFPPRGFDRLTPEQRVLAYHLSLAAIAGDPLFTMQSSRYGWPATQLVMRLLAAKDRLEPAFRDKLIEYRRKLFMHRGLHEAVTGRKHLPGFTQKELEDAAKTLSIEIPKDLLPGMFDAKVAPLLIDKTPSGGQDPITASAADHYEGVTTKDLATFKDRYELNGRIVKEKGKIVEQVYRAGGDGEPPGLAADVVGKVIRHLEDAIALAPPPEQEALRHMVKYFRTGDNAEFRAQDIAWLKQSFPVDYMLGFIETFSDVRGRKGNFQGLITIPDPDRDKKLQALAQNALYFEGKMPWEDRWKRTSFNVPAAAAVYPIAAAGWSGTGIPGGVNLPNAQDLREQYGTKNFLILTGSDVSEEMVRGKQIEEFVPEEARKDFHRCARDIFYAFISFHEITGHGSGKVNPDLGADPSALLSPYFGTLEEARADLVADYHIFDAKSLELGLLPDAACAKVYPAAIASSQLVNLAAVPEGEIVEEDHLRAAMIRFGYVKDKGGVAIEQRGGKTYYVVKDAEAWRKASGELLAELHRIKATGDKAAAKALMDKYGTRLDPKLRDEVAARRKALDLPRGGFLVPPILRPVRDPAGKVTDVKAEQVTSLDAYIAWFEEVWRG